jgi:hypothetical protein
VTTLRPATRLAICGLGVFAVSLLSNPATSASADRDDACHEAVTVTWSRTTTAYPSGQLVAPSKARVQDRCTDIGSR